MPVYRTSVLCASASLLFWFHVSQGSSPDSIALHFGNTITVEELYEHLDIVASDVMEGRDTGKSGQKMTAAYIRHQFMEMGLSAPVRFRGQRRYYQTFYLERVSPGVAWIEVEDIRIDDSAMLYTGRDGGGNITAPLVFIGDGSASILDEIDVEGKIALALGDELYSTRQLRKAVALRGARQLVVVYGDTHDDFLQMVKTYAPWYRRSELKLPGALADEDPGIFLVAPHKAEMLLGHDLRQLQSIASRMKNGNFRSWAALPQKTVTCHTSLKEVIVETENVLGMVEGKVKPEEIIVVSAHYDHVGVDGAEIYNGADDNGSGTVALLEIAEGFAEAQKNGHAPYRSVLFAAFTAEERGLLGSMHYTERPAAPLKQTVANLNLDMLGRIDPKHTDNPDYIYVIGSDKISGKLHEISERVNSTYTNLTLDYTYNADGDPNRYYYRSDHYNFAKHNIPSIFYFNGTHADYHKPSDTVDKIQFDLLKRRAQLVFHTAWYLANMPDRILPDSVAE
jgi:hypothetical protein